MPYCGRRPGFSGRVVRPAGVALFPTNDNGRVGCKAVQKEDVHIGRDACVR